MAEAIPMRGLIRVVPDAKLEEGIQRSTQERVAAEDQAARQASGEGESTQLVGYIRRLYDQFKRHRSNTMGGWDDRLIAALRAFNGEYPPEKLNEIKKFGGSEVYARMIAMKCRGASALLRDVYLSPERSWAIAPPADPDVPPPVIQAIQQLIQAELGSLQEMGGAPPDPGAIRDRVFQLMDAARQAEKKQAKARATLAQDRIEEILNEGGFYKALAEFIVDLPLFPFAVIKGPVVRIVPSIEWQDGKASVTEKPKLFWERVSPFDVLFTPGVSDIENADVIEKTRFRRADLNDLLDLPGYNHNAIRSILDEYGRNGLYDDWDANDTVRAQAENRENPHFNQSGMINCFYFTGNVQGRMLLDELQFGGLAGGLQINLAAITDPLRDYMVEAWIIGRHAIKVQLSPSPRKRHPYFITSFEKVPGTPVGNGLPDILSDIADMANATVRSLVNNMSIASGPQVVINEDRLAPGQDSQSLYPWKRWHMTNDPVGGSQQPVSFFQPKSNAQELLGIYKELNNMADELSAIPKYMSGAGASGGAGRTAAGLAMLMGNASKILQTVAANIDRDVMDPALNGLYEMLMLTDTSGLLQGDEAIRVMGVNVAVQRETERSRQLEFLQITANPLDQQIMGPQGRATVLRSVSKTIGLDGEEIVPSNDQLVSPQQGMAQPEQDKAASQAQGNQAGKTSTNDMGPRVQIAGGVG